MFYYDLSVAGGIKSNRICLSGGVPSADSGIVGVEADNLFSLLGRYRASLFVLYY
jgi:hypothetical protein